MNSASMSMLLLNSHFWIELVLALLFCIVAKSWHAKARLPPVLTTRAGSSWCISCKSSCKTSAHSEHCHIVTNPLPAIQIYQILPRNPGRLSDLFILGSQTLGPAGGIDMYQFRMILGYLNVLGSKLSTLWWTNIAMEMAIYSWFSHKNLWFSIAMLVHQRVTMPCFSHELRAQLKFTTFGTSDDVTIDDSKSTATSRCCSPSLSTSVYLILPIYSTHTLRISNLYLCTLYVLLMYILCMYY